MHDIEILAIIWVSVFIAAYLLRLTPVLWYFFCGAVLDDIAFFLIVTFMGGLLFPSKKGLLFKKKIYCQNIMGKTSQ
jgi:hypothetical protein